MQDSLNSIPDNEINLRELFMTLWAYKLHIISTCILGFVISVYHSQNMVKEYTSTAIFKLDKGTSAGFSFSKGKIDNLASLAGIGGNINTSALPMDQLSGRIFIEKLDVKLNFQADPFFNTYNPKSVEPIWKSIIKRAIGWQKSPINTQEAIWQGIVNTYSQNVKLGETKNGSATITVTHVNQLRAAEIANIVLDTIISTDQISKKTRQKEQLSYLSKTLAKALSELEVSQSNLKKFAMENSALPLESFSAGSIELDILREQLNQTSDLHEAVAALLFMIQNKTTNQTDYLSLRQKFPIIDQVEFRRVMGQNEIISSWSWPEINSVNAIFDTLSERKNRLQSKLNASQIDAERSGLALEAYAKLEREAKIAEATYTVLIEQVKAQSMLAGYQPDTTEVFEYASPSIYSSSTKRIHILLLGAISGLFVGIALSIFLSLFRDVYYSRKSLKTGAQTHLTFSIRTLLALRNKNLKDIRTMLVKKPRLILRDMAVEIHKSSSNQVVVTSSRSRLSSYDTARALASYMQSDTTKVAVINFSSTTKKLNVDYERLSVEPFVVAECVDYVSDLRLDGDLTAMELLAQKGFRESIQLLNSTFDLVFLSADNDDAMSLLSALEGLKAFHITLARTKKTKTTTVTQMRSRIPIQGLLYD
ncbi:hypothetical protein OAH94_01685 [Amylibacter sp.]|nr:hypothetical protein [Amylibacter sp.]